jgi:hypothetical protein
MGIAGVVIVVGTFSLILGPPGWAVGGATAILGGLLGYFTFTWGMEASDENARLEEEAAEWRRKAREEEELHSKGMAY